MYFSRYGNAKMPSHNQREPVRPRASRASGVVPVRKPRWCDDNSDDRPPYYLDRGRPEISSLFDPYPEE